MDIKQLCKYFNRKEIKKIGDNRFRQYKSLINGKVIIFSEGVEWLCKNVLNKNI